MLKTILLVLVAAATAVLLSGCGHWWYDDGPGPHHNSHYNHRDCGHQRY